MRVAVSMLRRLTEWCCPTPVHATPYEVLYPLDTELVETPANLDAGIAEEFTPDGRVRMRLTDGIFEYWADRAVTYKYLEVVARKYVIVFKCKELYVNIFRERYNALMEVAPTVALNPVFATLKRNAVSREAPANTAANRYRWLGKYVETTPPRKMSYTEFKKTKVN